jgi:endogenous inhibitor of DNA gyrase (YacG/DUF329 family)
VTPGPRKAADKSKGPRCPICGKPVGREHRPFCSKRCAEIDLGRWLKGAYAVPGEPAGKIGGAFDVDPFDDEGE